MKRADLILAVVVALVWGFTFTVIHVGLGSFPPLLFSALRFIAAAFPAVFFVRRGDLPWGLLLRVGLVFGVAYFALLFIGMNLGVPPGLSSLVVQSQAVLTAVLAAIVLRDPPVFWQKVGLAVAVAGMALIGWEFAGEGTVLGFALVILSAACWAVTNIMLKQAGRVDMFRLMIWMSLFPVIPLLVLSAVFESGQGEALAGMTWTGAGSVVYMGLLATVFGFGAWGRLLSLYPPTMVAPFSLLVPVFGMLFAALLLGEEFSALKLLGAVVVMAGLGVNVLGRIRHDLRALRAVAPPAA